MAYSNRPSRRAVPDANPTQAPFTPSPYLAQKARERAAAIAANRAVSRARRRSR